MAEVTARNVAIAEIVPALKNAGSAPLSPSQAMTESRNGCSYGVRISGKAVRIAEREADSYESLDDPQSFIEGLRRSGTRADLFTFMEIRPDDTPRFSYPVESDNLAILPISSFEHWWERQLNKNTRNRARLAERKGVIVREVSFDDGLIEGIAAIYNETPVRQGRVFPHYGKGREFVRLHASSFPETSIFVGAFLGRELIGFLKMTCDQTRTQANLMSILSMVRHRDKSPTNALIAQAVRICSERGICHLAYQNFSYGKRKGDSLSDFKRHNGFERVDVRRYWAPLTPLGKIAFRLGLHRRLVDRIPAQLMETFREFRSAWYSRKAERAAIDGTGRP